MTPRDAQVTVSGADPELDARLSAELTAFNAAATGADDEHEFTVRVTDDSGELVAGLSGWTWGTSAGIGMVWVRDGSRAEGWGAQLLSAAERVARERSCDRIHVSSFTFQAPGFYARHGYVETGRTEGIPTPENADVHFVKHLG